MRTKKPITHQSFVEGYKAGKYLVYIDKNRAGDFVLSKPADEHNRLAHLFWSWIGLIVTAPLTIVLFFLSWWYSVVSLIVGLIIVRASRKSAEQFVMQNMLDDKNFWEYVLMYGGAKIKNEKDEEIIFA